jgi:hypothetical protein
MVDIKKLRADFLKKIKITLEKNWKLEKIKPRRAV